METKNLFKLEAFKASPRSSESHDFDTDNSAKTWSIDILSRRRTIRNGNVVETTTPSCSVSIPSANWCSLKSNTVINSSQNLIRLEFNVESNTSSTQRVAYIGITQEGSGNGIILYLHQASGVTYTDYLEVPPQLMVINYPKGSTLTIKVISYSLGSDGSKVAKSPNVGATPSWCNQVSVIGPNPNHEYQITFTATETNNSNTIRQGEALITCGTARKSITLTQKGSLIESKFTLAGLPPKNCYLFKGGESPISGSSRSYLMIPNLGGETQLSIPLVVNLSNPGSTTEVDTGDSVTVYSNSSVGSYSYEGSFTVPAPGGKVSI